MKAIFKREFKSYFTTPVGYIVLATFYFFLGFYFWLLYTGGSPEIELVINAMDLIVVFLVPIITMRLMSDDRRQKIDQALLTAPVKLSGIVLGKFFAALAVLALCFAPTVIFELILLSNITVNVFSYIYTLFGMMLLGGTLIAIGMFISCLTESPAISAILTLVINVLITNMSNFADMITVPDATGGFFGKLWVKIVEGFVLFLEKAGFIEASQQFSEGIFSIPDVIYFVSIIAIFVFLSVRSLEKRRWS